MPSILVIGAASLDTLHIQGKRHTTTGGAGLYTALAASVADAETTLFAPKPLSIPSALQPIDRAIHWIGPTAEIEQISRLEIAHHGNGKATLVDASWGATTNLSAADLPADLTHYDIVHIAALPTAQMQLDFLHECRQRGASRISVGTYARVVYGTKKAEVSKTPAFQQLPCCDYLA